MANTNTTATASHTKKYTEKGTAAIDIFLSHQAIFPGKRNENRAIVFSFGQIKSAEEEREKQIVGKLPKKCWQFVGTHCSATYIYYFQNALWSASNAYIPRQLCAFVELLV